MSASMAFRAAGAVRIPTAAGRPAACRPSASSIRAASALRSSGAASLVGSSVTRPAQRVAPASAPSRRATVQVEAKCPIPPKSLCYALSAAWLAMGVSSIFGLTTIDMFYKAASSPAVDVMYKHIGTCMIAMAGAMCGEAHQHSAPTAAGIVFAVVSCAIVAYTSRAYMTPAGFAAVLTFDIVTAVVFLWKKYAEKSQAKLSMPSL
ncbi:uncharacterized protein LOC142357474 [Convolutriloba macropyga]|uniref:uncharacterized protein LOC142357474 n=1 Tax=Convolutriloba macropyga TaxID=536237 RepID=UPI003F520D74